MEHCSQVQILYGASHDYRLSIWRISFFRLQWNSNPIPCIQRPLLGVDFRVHICGWGILANSELVIHLVGSSWWHVTGCAMPIMWLASAISFLKRAISNLDCATNGLSSVVPIYMDSFWIWLHSGWQPTASPHQQSYIPIGYHSSHEWVL